jgi:hypothetical protein
MGPDATLRGCYVVADVTVEPPPLGDAGAANATLAVSAAPGAGSAARAPVAAAAPGARAVLAVAAISPAGRPAWLRLVGGSANETALAAPASGGARGAGGDARLFVAAAYGHGALRVQSCTANGSEGAGAAGGCGGAGARLALGGERGGGVGCPPPSRTKWTRRVPHPVLIGHAASLTPY